MNLYETPCRDCVFAVYNGLVQSGCQFGRLDKFRENGIEVEPVQDDEKQFFLIHTACLLHKDTKSPWAKETPVEERMTKARDEVSVKITLFIYADEGTVVKNVEDTLASVARQSFAPATVIIVANADSLDIAAARKLLTGDQLLHVVLQRNQDGSRLALGDAIDPLVNKSDSHYYCVVNAGFSLPVDYLLGIDRALNDDLKRFVALKPDKQERGKGVVMSVRAHKYFGGNTGAVVTEGKEEDIGRQVDSIIDKIEVRARAEGNEHLIRPLEEICKGGTWTRS